MNSNCSYHPGTPPIEPNRRFFGSSDLDIWRMTSKNNRSPFPCHCKLCASLRTHAQIQTGVEVRERPNWGKICFDLCVLDLWPFAWTSHLSMVITPKNVISRWQTLWKKRHRQTDGQKFSWWQLKTHTWKNWGPLHKLACFPHIDNTQSTGQN